MLLHCASLAHTHKCSLCRLLNVIVRLQFSTVSWHFDSAIAVLVCAFVHYCCSLLYAKSVLRALLNQCWFHIPQTLNCCGFLCAIIDSSLCMHMLLPLFFFRLHSTISDGQSDIQQTVFVVIHLYMLWWWLTNNSKISVWSFFLHFANAPVVWYSKCTDLPGQCLNVKQMFEIKCRDNC